MMDGPSMAIWQIFQFKVWNVASEHRLLPLEDRPESKKDRLGTNQVHLINFALQPDCFENINAIFDELKKLEPSLRIVFCQNLI